MEKMQVVEVGGIRVLTTKQIAEAYEAEEWKIKQNFSNNRKKYVEGKHFVILTGEDLRAFKHRVENFYLVGKGANKLCLWTEKGALLHAKSLNTDKAWEVYDYLVDFYFRVKEEPRQQAPEKEKKGTEVVDVPENAKIQNMIRKIKEDMICMNILLDECDKYVSMEEYAERRKAAGNIAGVIMMDMSNLSGIRPNMVRKPGI